MSDLAQRFLETLQQKNLFQQKDRLLLAVSGGVDSVVLADCCHRAGLNIAIAHCNFQLRGVESERDEQFVQSLSEKYNVHLHSIRFNTEEYATQNKLSIQEAARSLRYQWFDDLVKENQYDYLLTAHHADDNIETLLMHFFRGTGLKGLTGIPEKNNYIVRPLLDFTKQEIVDYAKANKLNFVEDSSNASSKYSRNYFRNEWLPQLEKIFPQVRENLMRNINRFKSTYHLQEKTLAPLLKRMLIQKGNEFHIPYKLLQLHANDALVYETISRFHFSEKQIEEVWKLMAASSGKSILNPDKTYRIIKHRNWLIISPIASTNNVIYSIEEPPGHLAIENGVLHWEQLSLPKEIATDANIACLDAAKITFPLIFRKWKNGDYFYPLGLGKKKKIARFLIDQKLSATEKENCWVVESNQRIVWVVGYRIDDRYKITPQTKRLLRLQFEKNRS